MKRLLLFIIGVLLASWASAQMIRANAFQSANTIQYGPEMITNGTFATAASWGYMAVYTIGGGVATYDDTGEGGLIQTNANMAVAIAVNKNYRLTFTATGNIEIRIYNVAENVTYKAKTVYVSGTNIVTFTTPANVQGGGIELYTYPGGTTGSTNIDNISLKEAL